MVPSRSGSPNRRGSSGSASSINTRVVPFISNYYSLLGDSPSSLVDLHLSDPEPHLKWQIPSYVIGGNPRIQGSTLLDNGILSIKGFGRNTLFTIFSSLPAISCKIPVEIMDVNETTENIITVSIHGHVISGDERFPFFQVLQIPHDEDSFLISNNIFYVFPVPLDLKSMRGLQSLSSQPSIISHSFSLAHSQKSMDLEDMEGEDTRTDWEVAKDHSQSQHVKTFPTYQDSKSTLPKAKPQIKIHGLSASSGLSDKDILSAVSFQLKSSNEGFAIAINRNRDEAVVQVDSVQSQELLSQRGIYIQGLKYRVSSMERKPNSGAKANYRKNNRPTRDPSSPSSAAAVPKKTSHQRKDIPDKDGWITVAGKGKGKTKTF